MKWNEELDALLFSHAGKLTTSEIAKILVEMTGEKVTRLAVLGRARKIGIESMRVKQEAELKRSIQRKSSPKNPDLRYVESPCFEGEGIPISQHQEGQCRWPFNGGTYCGEEVETNGYCAYHHYISVKGFEPTKRAILEGTVVFRNRRGHGVVAGAGSRDS